MRPRTSLPGPRLAPTFNLEAPLSSYFRGHLKSARWSLLRRGTQPSGRSREAYSPSPSGRGQGEGSGNTLTPSPLPRWGEGKRASFSSRPRMNAGQRVPFGRALRAACVVLLMLAARPAFALNVLGVYRSACDRVMGVVVRVERRDVHLLDLTGHMITIPRHEIVSLAYYPVPSLPIGQLALGPNFPMFRVKALQDKRIVDLVEGWPVDYSEEKISFLGRDGRDLVINRDSIWSIELSDSGQPAEAASAAASATDSPTASGFDY